MRRSWNSGKLYIRVPSDLEELDSDERRGSLRDLNNSMATGHTKVDVEIKKEDQGLENQMKVVSVGSISEEDSDDSTDSESQTSDQHVGEIRNPAALYIRVTSDLEESDFSSRRQVSESERNLTAEQNISSIGKNFVESQLADFHTIAQDKGLDLGDVADDPRVLETQTVVHSSGPLELEPNNWDKLTLQRGEDPELYEREIDSENDISSHEATHEIMEVVQERTIPIQEEDPHVGECELNTVLAHQSIVDNAEIANNGDPGMETVCTDVGGWSHQGEEELLKLTDREILQYIMKLLSKLRLDNRDQMVLESLRNLRTLSTSLLRHLEGHCVDSGIGAGLSGQDPEQSGPCLGYRKSSCREESIDLRVESPDEVTEQRISEAGCINCQIVNTMYNQQFNFYHASSNVFCPSIGFLRSVGLNVYIE